jgi:predicted DNA-binding transcriptional regulator AlpA
MPNTPLPPGLIGVTELSEMLQLSEATIRSDLSRRPHRLPPRCLLLGTNRLAWTKVSVDAWLEARAL